jgi:hypothetical protein
MLHSEELRIAASAIMFSKIFKMAANTLITKEMLKCNVIFEGGT